MTRLARAVVAGALVLTLDASIQEFAELVSLSDDARRERFHLPAACAPVIGAVRGAGRDSDRLTVFVKCNAPPTTEPSAIAPASWRNK